MLGTEIELTPCSKASIENLITRLPVLSKSLISYLEASDGDSRLIHPYWLLGPERIMAAYENLRSQNSLFNDEHPSYDFEEPPPFKFDKYWREKWIPIAELNNEDFFFIDMDPGEGGIVGQIGLLESMELNLIADSLEKWLEQAPGKIVPPLVGENEWEDQNLVRVVQPVRSDLGPYQQARDSTQASKTRQIIQ